MALSMLPGTYTHKFDEHLIDYLKAIGKPPPLPRRPSNTHVQSY
jgi:hypothetical protein